MIFSLSNRSVTPEARSPLAGRGLAVGAALCHGRGRRDAGICRPDADIRSANPQMGRLRQEEGDVKYYAAHKEVPEAFQAPDRQVPDRREARHHHHRWQPAFPLSGAAGLHGDPLWHRRRTRGVRLGRHRARRTHGGMADLDAAGRNGRARPERRQVCQVACRAGPTIRWVRGALYLYEGDQDTIYRIHGTPEPWSIGLDVSSGCIRMNNDDIIDLYSHVKVGAKVVVLMQGCVALQGSLTAR